MDFDKLIKFKAIFDLKKLEFREVPAPPETPKKWRNA